MSDFTPTLRFGPAGNSESFYNEGYSQTQDAFAWQQARFKLNAFEIPFGRGISMSEATAKIIGQKAGEAGVSLSAHAPYYINLANPDPDLAEKSIQYIINAASLLRLMGGERLVVHVGSPKGNHREQAMVLCAQRLLEARKRLLDAGLGRVRLCLETMGRPSVLGTTDEIIRLVTLEDSFLPCVDFAHLHAVSNGGMDAPERFESLLNHMENVLGLNRARAMHMHFSKIEYGAKGEIRHKTFADPGFGPDYAHLLPLLAKRQYGGVLICESRGTMAEDAGEMKASWDTLRFP